MKTSLVLCAGLLLTGSVYAQGFIPTIVPNNPDNLTLSDGEPFNSAMIQYCPTSEGCDPTNALFGIAWEGAGLIYVHDVGTGLSATCAAVGAGTPPDVVIGNNFSVPGDFIMAVAYSDYLTHIVVDFYDITGAGTPGLTITWINSASIVGLSTTHLFSTVHIDLIADHATPPAMPLCNRFIVTWDDPALGTINATSGTLNPQVLNTPPAFYFPIAAPLNSSQPDVAAIQRFVGSPHDLALIPFIGPAGQLLYTELDFTSPAIPAITALDATPLTTFLVPRIDAVDDYTVNSTPGLAQYMIAAQANLPGGVSQIWTYSNLIPLGSHFGSSDPMDVFLCCRYTSSTNHFSPVVALSGPHDYSVYHWTEMATIGPPLDKLSVLDPVDRTIPMTLFPNDHYWVNGVYVSGIPPSPPPVNSYLSWLPGTWNISTSSPVNFNLDPSCLTVYVWAEEDGGVWNTNYKLSGSPGFAFRHAASGNANIAQPDAQWALLPNPATNELTIKGGAETDVAYQLIDMRGGVVLQGSVTSGSVTLDVGALAPGNYLVKLISHGNTCANMKFVKE